jgi:serine/threonine protein kinase
MTVADIHPSIAELASFTLGMLDDDGLAAVERHVADCPTCQELAADSAGDDLVEMVRRIHAQTTRGTDTVAQTQTPGPVPADPANGTEVFHAVPQELARHERYRIVRLLGEGGMGSVYEAEHRVMQRPVAVKVIKSALTSRPAAVERFRREVRAAARLVHPNIVTTYDAEDAGNTLFLVMEYVEGISLARLIGEKGPLPVAVACDYVRQAALGLQHAHERGMVHRDVKPDNLILSASPVASTAGVVKVLDFGLAALLAERGDGLTETNVVMGTPDYMAPEQAEDSGRADIRADVYSLGCTFYYLLTGKVPYPGTTSLQKILAHREQPVPDIRRTRPEVPAGLARVLERMIVKKPEDRYQTPGQVAAALAPFTHSANLAPKRRSLLAAIAGALFAVIVVATGVVYRVQTDTGELIITTESDDVDVIIKERGNTVRIVDTKSDKEIALTLRSGVYELELKGAPNGLKLSLERATLTRGETVLAKVERVLKVPGPTDSADVKLVQPLHRFPFTDGDRFYSVDVTQDGRYVLAGRGGVNRVRVWDMHTGKLFRELDGTFACFTPDGNSVIATSKNALNVYDLPTGKRVRRFGPPDLCHNIVLAPDGTRLHTVTPTHHEIYDWATGTQLCQIPWRENGEAFLTHDGRYLLLQPDHKPPFRVVDCATGKDVDALQQLRDVPYLRSISSDGNRLLCYSDGGCRIFDAATGKAVADFAGYGLWAKLSGDGRLLLNSTNRRNESGVWDVDSGRLLARLQFLETFAGIYDRRVSRDNRYAVFAGPGDFVYVFRLPDTVPAKPKP